MIYERKAGKLKIIKIKSFCSLEAHRKKNKKTSYRLDTSLANQTSDYIYSRFRRKKKQCPLTRENEKTRKDIAVKRIYS